MISHTTKGFWKLHETLPEQVQRQAKTAYRRFEEDPFHPSLQFKQVHDASSGILSQCVEQNYSKASTGATKMTTSL